MLGDKYYQCPGTRVDPEMCLKLFGREIYCCAELLVGKENRVRILV